VRMSTGAGAAQTYGSPKFRSTNMGSRSPSSSQGRAARRLAAVVLLCFSAVSAMHAAFFKKNLPSLIWQPTDTDSNALGSGVWFPKNAGRGRV
jgi:hypothetical protein